MATFSFDRPLVLTEEEATKFLEIAMKPAKPDNIKPYEPNNEEDEELIEKWYESQRKKIKVLSLGKLLLKAKTQEDIQNLMDLLSSFSCSQDKDIEDFLHNRAIDFERINKSRTYILCYDCREENGLVILGVLFC